MSLARAQTLDLQYWSRFIQTMPREQLGEFHLRRLQGLLRYAYARSPFYRRKFDRIGLRPEDIRTLEDFKHKVPITDKDELMAAQAESPPYGATLAVAPEEIAFHVQTSGTTGRSLMVPLTLYDTERYGEPWLYGWWAAGIRPSDSFYIAFSWGLFSGFWTAHWAIRRLGGTFYPSGGQTTEGHIQQILTLKPTVLLATPTYAMRLARAAREMGIDPAETSVRYVWTAGEPGPYSLPAVRAQLESEWGAHAGDHYGIAELDAFGPGCPTGKGVHMCETNTFSWSRDPQTGKEVAEGEIGENIITTYVNSAQPLLNYRSHDLVRRRFDCACGCTWAMLEGVVLGRTDFMMTVKGVNVYPSAVENLITQIPGVSNHYRMILTRDDNGLDQMAIEFEPEAGVGTEPHGALAERVQERLHAGIGLQFKVRVQPPESLPRYDMKTRRIIDERPDAVRRELERKG